MDDGRSKLSIALEEWRPVFGIDGYEVSSRGQVRSIDRIVVHGLYGNCRQKGRLLSPHINHDGYLRVRVNRRFMFVHVMVLEAFKCPRPDGMQGCHNDGNPENSYIDNLRWDTPSNNVADRRHHGTYQLGEKNPNNKLTPEQVLLIREDNRKYGEIAKDFGISECHVSSIKHRRLWTHI